VNRTCILKLQSEKKYFKILKSTIFKNKYFVQKNRAMAKNLVIVESLKAKTIEKFLGSDFQVESQAYTDFSKIGVDVEHGFKPKYEVSSDKKALVSKLKALAKKADMVWLASDEDREEKLFLGILPKN
jgi:reverse gyrase